MVAYHRILNGSRLIANLACILIFFTINNLLGITRHSNVGIVCHNDNLAFLLCSTNAWDKLTVNRLIIQIVLWLVYNNRFAFFTECQIKNKQYNPAFTRRKFFQGSATHFKFKINPYIFQSKYKVVVFLSFRHSPFSSFKIICYNLCHIVHKRHNTIFISEISVFYTGLYFLQRIMRTPIFPVKSLINKV